MQKSDGYQAPPLQVFIFDNAGRNLALNVDFSDVIQRPPEYADGFEACDLCQRKLTGLGQFVDGRLRNKSFWACMCPSCFEAQGSRIGVGEGQLYAEQIDGRWRLVSGFTREQDY